MRAVGSEMRRKCHRRHELHDALLLAAQKRDPLSRHLINIVSPRGKTTRRLVNAGGDSKCFRPKGKITLQNHRANETVIEKTMGQIFSNESEELISFFFMYIFGQHVSTTVLALEKHPKWKWSGHYNQKIGSLLLKY